MESDDMLKVLLKHGADWSYLGKDTKDELIKEIIQRILKLEENRNAQG